MCYRPDRLRISYFTAQILVGIFAISNIPILIFVYDSNDISQYKIAYILAMLLSAIDILFTVLGLIAVARAYEMLLWITGGFKVFVLFGYLIVIIVLALPHESSSFQHADFSFNFIFAIADISFPFVFETISGLLLVFIIMDEY